MGILRDPAKFIAHLKLAPGFSVCELGDQRLSFTKAALPASTFYRDLGCGRYVSIDGNGQGSITADLNYPLTAKRLGHFDLVTDFGTGEHIFDQAQVWRTVHDLTKRGGYIVFDRPHQGYGKHCFYLANPCLIEDLARANGYVILRMEKLETPRGWLLRGVLQRPHASLPFRIPQQGRYRSDLRIPIGGGA